MHGLSRRLRSLQAVTGRLFRSPALSAFLIFTLASALRLIRLAQYPSEYMVPNPNWELNAIAISLMEEGQFADPYMLHTGPTAHLPPLYPFLVSLIFRAFGLTARAGYATVLVIILTASLLYALLPWIAEAFGLGRPAGVLGGLAGAVLVEWAGHGEYLSGLALAPLLIWFVRRWSGSGGSLRGATLLGLAIGISLHLQPALLPVFLTCLVFELWWRRDPRVVRLAGAVVLGAVIVSLPWACRNVRTFGSFVFIRSNLGLELMMGHHEGVAASMEIMDEMNQRQPHPRVNVIEARRVQELGEIGYMRWARQQAFRWIGEHPREFAVLTLQRAAYFWLGPLYSPRKAAGIALLTALATAGIWLSWREMAAPQRAAVVIPLLTFPTVYYLVPYMPRYRTPIDWILLMLAGAAIARLARRTFGCGGHSPDAGQA